MIHKQKQKMTKRDELITDMLKKDLKSIKKTLKDQEVALKDLKDNGFGEIHKGNRAGIWDGYNYTIGYCTGHIKLAEDVISMMKMNLPEINTLIAENKKIEEANKKELKRVFDLVGENLKGKAKSSEKKQAKKKKV